MTRLPIRPMGTLRCGFRVSSAAVDTASKPTYAKKIDDAALTTPRFPSGLNGSKFSARIIGMASTMNTARAVILIDTRTAFTLALSRVPMMSSHMQNRAMAIAGRLITPPA